MGLFDWMKGKLTHVEEKVEPDWIEIIKNAQEQAERVKQNEATIADLVAIPEVAAPEVAAPKRKPRKPRAKKVDAPVIEDPINPEKEAATAAGEPWVAIKSVMIDPDNVSSGAFELDWNDTFLARLLKAGYKGKTDHDIVDQWFSDICRNVLAENYEQEMADPELRRSMISKRDLGDGRTEVS